MSFIDTLGGIAKKGFGLLTGKSIGSTLARTALLGFALKKINDSANKGNDSDQQDQGSEVTLEPDTNFKVPVLYGSGFVNGKVIDARLTNNNTHMWLAVVLCEKTGTLIDGSDSVINFNEVYIDNFRISFKDDGVTSDLIYDDNGNNSDVWRDLIEVYPFNNGSSSPANFTSESTGNVSNAYSIFPQWDSTKAMTGLVFALIRYKYNAKNKLTTVGSDIKFKLTNTMTEPGDVLNDYLQNTKYGAGVPSSEVNDQ